MGDLLPAAAGYENEEAGNAAFDPAEYLDVMISTGHQPYLMRGRDGYLTYGEKMPGRPLTQQEDEHLDERTSEWLMPRVGDFDAQDAEEMSCACDGAVNRRVNRQDRRL